MGRSSKCNFVTKNDKSISRQHLSFEWDKDMLVITNFGKVTQVDGIQLNDKEIVRFSSITNGLVETPNKTGFISYEVHMGTTPIIVKLIWVPENWIIPCSVPNELRILKNYGINLIEQQNLTIDDGQTVDAILDLPDNKSYKPYRDLFCLSNNIRTFTKDTIDDLLKWIDQNVTNFEEEWQNPIGYSLFEGRAQQSNIDEKLKRTIKDIYFCTIGCLDKVQLTYSSLIFAALGTTHINIDTTQKLREFTKEHTDDNLHLILIRGSEFKDKSDNYILESTSLINIEDLKECLLDRTINKYACTISELRDLLNEERSIDIPPQEEISNEINEKKSEAFSRKENIMEDNPKPVKRRRIARPKVKPLNSLSFFVGGGDGVDQAKTNKIEETKEPSIEPTGDVATIPVENVELSKEVSNNSGKTTQIKGGDFHDNLVNSDNHELEINRSLNKDVSATYETAIEPIPESTEKNNTQNEKTNERVEYTTHPTRLKSPIDHHDINTDNRDVPDFETDQLDNKENDNEINEPNLERPKTLVDVIRSTKSKAVERLKTDIVEVRPEELTDSAINDFANLEIEENPSLIVQRDRFTVEQARGPWHGRKNFKTFVKVYPSSRKNHDSITNAALLITRSYVDTKLYDKTSKWKKNDDFDVGEAINSNHHYEGNDSFEDDNRHDNMVTDDAIIDTIKDTVPDKRRILINENENSSDEGSNSFSFSRAATTTTKSTNGLFVTNDDDDEEGDIDDFGMTNGLQIPSSHEKRTDVEPTTFSERNNNSKKISRTSSYKTPTKTSSTYRSKLANSINIDSDDSDDSDDGPNFKFKRTA